MVRDLLLSDREVLFYAMTPPRMTTSLERVKEIADAASARLSGLDIDALILYDLDDESDRNDNERPFPYMETMDPAQFLTDSLPEWRDRAIVYRCAGKYDEAQVREFLRSVPDGGACVLVGAGSSKKPVKMRLPEATQLTRELRPDITLGAVAIPERHRRHEDEHNRLLRKQDGGAGFFVTQVVYNTNEAKNLASDYVYACEEKGQTPARIVFTLSLCGSEKTLDFLQWLGVDVPQWVQNELRRSRETLDASYEYCLAAAHELARFCRYLGLPFGFNIESVSTRKVEIDATVQLAREVATLLNRGPGAGPQGAPQEVAPTSAFGVEIPTA